MSEAKADIIDIVLWGGTQVGKTTVLATYLCHRPPPWLDTAAPETRATLRHFAVIWNALRRNELRPGTIREEYYLVRRKDGRLIRFRDMKGGNTGDTSKNEADFEALRKANALILFIQWPKHGSTLDVIAVENALLFASHCPRVMAITKVEGFLTPEKLTLFSLSPVQVAREMGLSLDFVELLQHIPPSDIVPLSVYGYSEDDYPAHYRDEFGRFVPWYIKPRNVALPFERVLEELD